MYCNNCGNAVNDGATICAICGTKMEEIEAEKQIKQKCCVCGNTLDDKRETLLIGKNGEQKDVCVTCALHMDALENNANKTKVKEAIEHFNYYRNYMDREAKDCIEGILKEKQISNNSGSASAGSTSWVVVLRAVAWLIFWGAIVAGLVIGIVVREMGFIIFLVSILVAFLSVAWTMIFLDLADDIRAIRNQTEERK